MGEYKANSHRSKAEEANNKRVEKVVTGKTKVRKNELRKFSDVFIAEDAGNVKSIVLFDILVPAIKNVILDIIIESSEMVFGDGGRSRKRKSRDSVSYRKYFDDKRHDRVYDRGDNQRRPFDYEDIIFESRGEAEDVRMHLLDLLDTYPFVTVADLYDMCDITAPHTANKYGWTNLRTAETIHVRDGYIIKLPKAMLID